MDLCLIPTVRQRGHPSVKASIILAVHISQGHQPSQLRNIQVCGTVGDPEIRTATTERDSQEETYESFHG